MPAYFLPTFSKETKLALSLASCRCCWEPLGTVDSLWAAQGGRWPSILLHSSLHNLSITHSLICTYTHMTYSMHTHEMQLSPCLLVAKIETALTRNNKTKTVLITFFHLKQLIFTMCAILALETTFLILSPTNSHCRFLLTVTTIFSEP